MSAWSEEALAFLEKGDHECFAEEDDQHALAGADGKRATKLLAAAKEDGARVYAEACESAVRRLLATGDPLGQGVLFDDAELEQIAEALARGIATADLMGRARVRRRAELAERRAEGFAEAFAELRRWSGPYTGERGGRYWLPVGSENVPENRYYSPPAGSKEAEKSTTPNQDYELSLKGGAAAKLEVGLEEDDGETTRYRFRVTMPDGASFEAASLNIFHGGRDASPRGREIEANIHANVPPQYRRLGIARQLYLIAADIAGARGGVLTATDSPSDAASLLWDSLEDSGVSNRWTVDRRKKMLGHSFSELANDDPFDVFADPVPSMTPESAVAYFQRLVPTLAPAAVRYGPRLDRHTFTLAAASDQVLLDRVKAAILKALTEGTSGTPEVQEILDAAGVSEKNPQYAEMVTRSNIMDAFNQGQAAELAEPDMQEAFPVWQYNGIDDDRAGDDHRPKFNRYYPASVSFSEVRGARIFNCRCSHSGVHKSIWAELQRTGTRAETTW